VQKYRLPEGLGYLVTHKLDNKIPLHANEYSGVCRKLADSIELFSLHPERDSVENVVLKFILKYPNTVLNEIEPGQTKVL
jgi:hypothetical protein